MKISVSSTYSIRILYRKIEKDKISVLTEFFFFFVFQFVLNIMPAGIVSPELFHLLPIQYCAVKIKLFTYGKAPNSCSGYVS